MDKLKASVERSVFGVCSYIGERIGLSTYRVRLYFIYASFIALGSPLIVYLFVAFWVNLKKYLRKSRNAIWGI